MNTNHCLRWTMWVTAALLAVVVLSGCNGCNRDPLVERKKELDDIDKKKKKERKENFELNKVPRTIPADELAARPFVKPGHWVTVMHEIKANNFKFNARLDTSITDSRGNQHNVPNTSYQLSGSRPAPLPKGQARLFETTYFIPRTAADTTRQVWLNRELRAARGGRLVRPPDPVPVTPMDEYQYYFMVLSEEPERYGFLKRLTALNVPTGLELERESMLHYRVLLPHIRRIAPLPSRPLTWTSLAYILIDDADPTWLSPDQESALLDWLHWGGQVIISGPKSLDRLRGGFLDGYLPAHAGDIVEIDPAAVDELNAHWSLSPHAETGHARKLTLLPQQPMIGVQLLKHSEAREVPNCAGLVFERRVGQGRIVVTSFALNDRYLMTWGASYDSFINACLLRRPRRQFSPDAEGLVADTVWVDYRHIPMGDARMVTTLRYFSRDAGHFGQGAQHQVEPGEAESLDDEAEAVRERLRRQQRLLRSSPSLAEQPPRRPAPPPAATSEPDWHLTGYPQRGVSGMAAWNDRSGVSDAARMSLEDAAGISIPQGRFVLQVLAVYLVVLAPLNWFFFRLIRRVEWAWVAAPVIAIVGAFAVVRLAQLDIGFASSTTEVAVAEMQGDYPRAHVTRYTALYTSLSTPYDFVFSDLASLAQPLGGVDYRSEVHERIYQVTMHRERDLRLGGFQVASNSIGYMHSEQMCDLGGPITLVGDDQRGFQVNNGTAFQLHDVGLLRRQETGNLQTAWVGDLSAKSSADVEFLHRADGRPHREEWDATLTTLSYTVQIEKILNRLDTNKNRMLERDEAAADAEIFANFQRIERRSSLDNNLVVNGRWESHELLEWCRQSRSGELSLGGLIELASQSLQLHPGDVRLIGWSDQPLPELVVHPTPAQAIYRTLFVVHLRRGPLPAARRDVNCKQDVVKEIERRLDEYDLLEPELEAEPESATQPLEETQSPAPAAPDR